MKTWHAPWRYHGIGGISRGILVVRHGASKSFPFAMFRPMMPPMIVSGSVTRAQMTMITTIVPKGSAACEVYAIATVLRKANVTKNGAGKSVADSTRFIAHLMWEGGAPSENCAELRRKAQNCAELRAHRPDSPPNRRQ